MSEHEEWEDKSCLVTGGNGYLGKHVVKHFCEIGWKVKTLGRCVNNAYSFDISTDDISIDQTFEVVIHCAGKAHNFPKTEKEQQAFYDVNVRGTQSLLDALEKGPTVPRTFVFMSSVSVYGLKEGVAITEEAILHANHPYGKSKIAAEKIITEWCEKHQVTCLIFRLPLLAGSNPPGNLAAMIDAIKKGYYLNIRKNARKSIVMAEDVAKLISRVIDCEGIYNLTDGNHPSVKELADLIASQLGKKSPISIPRCTSKVLLFLVNKFSFLSRMNSYKLQKLSNTLTFDDSKARRELGWNPSKVLDHFSIK